MQPFGLKMTIKEKIIQVSLQQFLKYGIRKMTVQKLVEPLGLSTKTVYKHFTDKEDLLKQCLIVHYSNLSLKLAALEKESSSPVVTICKLWHEAIHLDFGATHIFYHDLNYYYPQLQDSVINKIFRRNPLFLKTLIEKGIRQKFFRSELEPVIIIEVMGLLYTTITRTDKFKKIRLSPALILQNTIDLYLRGLCTEKGLRELNLYYSTIIK